MTAPRRRAVILGAVCYRDAAASMTICSLLARDTGGELVGLLVEDDTLASITGRLGFRGAALPGPQRAAYQADARAFRRGLEAAARAAALDWRFEHRQGRPAAVTHEMSTGGDLVVFGYAKPTPAYGDVVLIAGAAPDPETAALAARLARQLRRRLTVLTLGAAVEADPDGPAPEIVAVTPETLYPRLGRLSVAAVVVAPGAVPDSDAARLLDAARAPVVMRRAED